MRALANKLFVFLLFAAATSVSNTAERRRQRIPAKALRIVNLFMSARRKSKLNFYKQNIFCFCFVDRLQPTSACFVVATVVAAAKRRDERTFEFSQGVASRRVRLLLLIFALSSLK